MGKIYSGKILNNKGEIIGKMQLRKMTNYERIKAMGVDELSKIIMCPYFRSEPCGNGKDCNKCCKEWLESEVEEEE